MFFVNDKNKNDGVFDVINNFMFEISTMLVINSSSIIPFLEKMLSINGYKKKESN